MTTLTDTIRSMRDELIMPFYLKAHPADAQEQPEVSDKVCPECEGCGGKWVGPKEYWDCPTCQGTGKVKS